MSGRNHLASGCDTRFLLLASLLVFGTFRMMECAPHQRNYYQAALRLCSTNLSDALYLICRDRGYNEPFSYSSEDEPRVIPGPGLVEECCRHSCSYEHLEQYCKPSKEKKDSRDAIKNVYGLVPLPLSSARKESSLEENSRTDYADGAIKRKGVKKSHKRGHNDHVGGCRGIKLESTNKKDTRDRCQRRRCRRRRPGKTQQDRTTIKSWPEKSSGTSTERKKLSSKSHEVFEDSANDSSMSS